MILTLDNELILTESYTDPLRGLVTFSYSINVYNSATYWSSTGFQRLSIKVDPINGRLYGATCIDYFRPSPYPNGQYYMLFSTSTDEFVHVIHEYKSLQLEDATYVTATNTQSWGSLIDLTLHPPVMHGEFTVMCITGWE